VTDRPKNPTRPDPSEFRAPRAWVANSRVTPKGTPGLRRPGLLCPVAVALTMTLYRRHHPIVGIYQFSPINRGSCSEQSITSRRMFFQRSPVGGTKQRLCRQNEGSRATGDSFGADEFSDGHAIVIRHSSIPPPRLRGRRGVRGLIGVRERQNG
jgi:hypothetical protein